MKANSRRSRHRQEVRDRILAAAYELASERDFEKIAVHDITDLADVGRGTLFNYFGHKDTVLVELGQSMIGRIEAVLTRARASQEPIKQLMTKYLQEEFAGRIEPKRLTMFGNFLQERVRSEPIRMGIVEIHKAWSDRIAEFISIGQAKGEFRSDYSAPELANYFKQVFMGFGLMIWQHRGFSNLDSKVFPLLIDTLAGSKATDKTTRTES